MPPPTKAEIRQLRRTVPSPTKANMIPPAKADTPPPAKLRRECHSLPIIRALSRLTLNVGFPDIVWTPDRLYVGELRQLDWPDRHFERFRSISNQYRCQIFESQVRSRPAR